MSNLTKLQAAILDSGVTSIKFHSRNADITTSIPIEELPDATLLRFVMHGSNLFNVVVNNVARMEGRTKAKQTARSWLQAAKKGQLASQRKTKAAPDNRLEGFMVDLVTDYLTNEGWSRKQALKTAQGNLHNAVAALVKSRLQASGAPNLTDKIIESGVEKALPQIKDRALELMQIKAHEIVI